MRIVNRTTFLTLPAGVLFMKFPSQPADGSYVDLGYDEQLAIKGETIGDDFVSQPLFPWFEGVNDSGGYTDTLVDMIAGASSPPVDYDFAGRDGLFDAAQLFAVWNKEDLGRLIARLQEAFDSQ